MAQNCYFNYFWSHKCSLGEPKRLKHFIFTQYVSLITQYFIHQVDFDAPLGYKEPERHMQHPEEPAVCSDNSFHHIITQYFD